MKYKCDIKIMGVPQRMMNITENALKLNLTMEDVFLDNECSGMPILTSFGAFNLPHEEGVTHRLVLQDDVEIIDGLAEYINEFVNMHPEAFWTLFLHTTSDVDVPYGSVIQSGARMYGQAIIIPLKYVKEIQSMYYAMNSNFEHDDAFYSTYAKWKGLPILTTYPNCVQHIGVGKSNSTMSHSYQWRSKMFTPPPDKSQKIKWLSRVDINLRLSPNGCKIFDQHYKHLKPKQ